MLRGWRVIGTAQLAVSLPVCSGARLSRSRPCLHELSTLRGRRPRVHSAPKSASSRRRATAGPSASAGRGATTRQATAAPQAPTAPPGWSRRAARAALGRRTGGPRLPSRASEVTAARQRPAPSSRRLRPWRRPSQQPAPRPLVCSPAASGCRGQVAAGAPADLVGAWRSELYGAPHGRRRGSG